MGAWQPTGPGLLFALLMALAVLAGLAPVAAQDEAAREAVVLEVEGPIGPATSDYISRSLEDARERDAALVILRMDTPGGLDSAMRAIIREILASEIPVIAYVAPNGARAASAGTYILYASHVAAMAPATNLGAATPVQIGGPPSPAPQPEDGGEGQDDREEGEEEDAEAAPAPGTAMERKMVNDAVAYIRGLAELRGRNADWAERAVREAETLTAGRALEMNVIEIVAPSVEDLVRQLDGREVKVLGETRTLETSDLAVITLEPDWRNRLLAIVTDPNVAYILMLIGIYGIIYEFLNPGALVPGVVGAICLLLALFAFAALPIDYAGIALIALGLAFMVAEAFLPSFGALGVGGVIAFLIGSVILFDRDVPGFYLSWPVIVSTTAVAALGMFGIMTMALSGRRRPVVSGREGMIGSLGRVVATEGTRGRVRVQGEIWQARSGTPLKAGQTVRLVGMDGLTLIVEPVEENNREGTLP